MRLTLCASMLFVVGVAGGCDGDAPAVPDAGPDAPIDAAIDAGCGLDYTGELVDWDSNDTTFLGINAATFTVREDPTRTAMTAPNGRFMLCIPDGNFAIVDVAMPADYLPGLAFAKHDVIRATGAVSMRSMTAARRDSFFAGMGLAFDPAAGQVLVHFNGTTPRRAQVVAGAAATQAYNSDGAGGFVWAAGDTGLYVFFGNVPVGATANTVVTSDAAGVIGSATVPLVPGAISFVELHVP